MSPRDENPNTESFPIPSEDNPWDQAEGQRYMKRQGTVGPIIIVVILVIIALALAGAVWAWLSGDGNKHEDPAAVAPSTSTVTASSSHSTTSRISASSSSRTSSSTSSSTRSSHPTSSRTSSAPSTTAEPTPPPRPAAPPIAVGQDGQTQCGHLASQGVWSGNANTSCEFANEVANTAIGMPDTDVQQFTVRSPVTGQRYTMTCRGLGHGYIECSGGDQAQVIITGPGR